MLSVQILYQYAPGDAQVNIIVSLHISFTFALLAHDIDKEGVAHCKQGPVAWGHGSLMSHLWAMHGLWVELNEMVYFLIVFMYTA